jgi:Zn-dependent alcohol dehydrogenase
MTTTLAALVRAVNAPFAIEEVEVDEPRADVVLVRLVATGLCHTDLSAQAGIVPFPLPGVLSHQGAGIVEQVSSAVRRVALVDERCLVKLPPDAPLGLLAPLGCGIQTGAALCSTCCDQRQGAPWPCLGSAPLGVQRSWRRR